MFFLKGVWHGVATSLVPCLRVSDPLPSLPFVREWLESYGGAGMDGDAFDRCEADWHALLARRERQTGAYLAGLAPRGVKRPAVKDGVPGGRTVCIGGHDLRLCGAEGWGRMGAPSRKTIEGSRGTMGYSTGYIDLDYTPDAVNAVSATESELRWEVEKRMWDEGSDEEYYPDSRTLWHEDKVYDTWEQACEATDHMATIDRCHAVLYRVPDPALIEKAPSMQRLIARADTAEERLGKLNGDSDVRKRKRDFISCTRCDSRISLAFLKDPHDCPVCGADLRSPDVLLRVHEAENELKGIIGELHAERRRLGALKEYCQVRWCVAYAFHV